MIFRKFDKCLDFDGWDVFFFSVLKGKRCDKGMLDLVAKQLCQRLGLELARDSKCLGQQAMAKDLKKQMVHPNEAKLKMGRSHSLLHSMNFGA